MCNNFYSLATIYLIDKNKSKEKTSIIQQGKLLVSIKKEIHKFHENKP